MVLISLGLVSCVSYDEQYYRVHPKKLQQALKNCPSEQPQGLTCDQVKQLSTRMNNLAYQLQSNPQGFGNKILSLQETIAKQEIQASTKDASYDVNTSLTQNKQDLADYLAVVKWLESPES